MTDHVKDQLCARIEELEAEKMELNEQLDALQQRDALAAHLERLVRVNREQQALLDQVYQYVDEQGLAKLGQSRVKALIEAHKRAEAESGALAAHLERLQRALKATMVSGWSVPAEEALVEVFSDSPQTSLVRIKAQWQAEALEWLFDKWESHWLTLDLPRHIANRAAKLRRQAEGGEE